MNRRGLTLMELLVALALILAMGAVVFPVMFSRLGESAFESTGEQLRGQLLLARAHAMASGTPLEVRYRADRDLIEVVPFDAGLHSFSQTEFRAASRGGRAGDEDPMDLQYEEDRTDGAETLGSWANMSIPVDMIISRTLPDPDDFDFNLDFDTALDPLWDELDELDGAEDSRPLRLVVYVANGSALLARTTYLLDDDGRRSRIEVNEWTGLPTVERLPDLSEAADGLLDDDDPFDDFDDDSGEEEPPTNRPGSGGGKP